MSTIDYVDILLRQLQNQGVFTGGGRPIMDMEEIAPWIPSQVPGAAGGRPIMDMDPEAIAVNALPPTMGAGAVPTPAVRAMLAGPRVPVNPRLAVMQRLVGPGAQRARTQAQKVVQRRQQVRKVNQRRQQQRKQIGWAARLFRR